MRTLAPGGPPGSLRARTYHVIFDHDTAVSRLFDVLLIGTILASVAVVMLDSVPSVSAEHRTTLLRLEWMFTVLFTIEYALRLWSVKPARAYAWSWFGIIDLLAVLPTYVSLLVPGGQFLLVVRVLRVTRIFRIFELARYVGEADELSRAFKAARYRITVFLLTVVSIVAVVGTLMFVIEGPASGFTSIPLGMYWAVVTLTTVGYGDLVPATATGKALASILMIVGYGIIAVPVGIVTAELAVGARQREADARDRRCPSCRRAESDAEALYCRRCGTPLGDPVDRLGGRTAAEA